MLSSTMPLISATELEVLLREPEAGDPIVVLDVSVSFPPARFDGDYRPESGQDDWRRTHIQGSRHVDLLTTFSASGAKLHFTKPSAEQLANDLAAVGIDPGTSIVVYDQGSMTWASRLWWVLRNAGIDARVLDGGLAVWVRLDLPVAHGVERDPMVSPLKWTLGDRDLWVGRDLVAAVVAGASPGTLVCALSTQQFEGAEKTRYSRRGHISTSLNFPAKSLVDEHGLFRPLADVAELASAVLPHVDQPTYVYCGGGVSACLTALGLVATGYSDVKIYDGSLEEWTADPELPMATGEAATDGRCPRP